jgi:hypothetical protein
VRGWLGRDAQGFQRFASAFHAAEAGQAGATASLAALADDVSQPPIVRASALERLAAAGTSDAGIAQRAARDAQPLLRLAAVRLAESLPPSQQERVLGPLLSDPLLAVRIEAARAMAGSETRSPPSSAPPGSALRTVPGDAWLHRRSARSTGRARQLQSRLRRLTRHRRHSPRRSRSIQRSCRRI